MAAVDDLAALLDGPRARGAFLLRCVLDPPWAIRIQDEAPLSVTAVLRGHAWVTYDDGEQVRLAPGDLAVMRGPDPSTFGDDPATAVQAVIHPGQVCRTPDGRDLADEMHQGVRSWGNAADPAAAGTVLLTGAYGLEGEVGVRLLRALPRLVVLGRDDLDSPLVDLLAAEVGRETPGQQAVLDRLLDLLLIAVLRAWFDRAEAETPRWYAAQADPVVGPALRLMQHQPEHPWSVAGLATEVGASRAAFARRFHDLVGTPPMAYLTEWRLGLAADLLLEPTATVAAVARQVGYSTPFALSTAFKRARGMSPREHRARPAAPALAGAGA